MSEKNKNKGQSGFNKFRRRLLDMDRPLTMKERASADMAGDEFYLRITKPPKDLVMSEKTFKGRQQAKRRVNTAKRFLNKK